MSGHRVTVWGVGRDLFLFLVVSVLVGLLVAGLTVPFAGMAGLGMQSATSSFYTLPSELPKLDPPERSRMLDADGNVIATFFDQNRVNLASLDDIAPVMRKALIAIEDSRFYQHGPMDAQGAARAFVRNNQAGQTTQGGSSITQQYVKQVLAESADSAEEHQKALEDSYGRKLQELRYAVEVEKQLSKDDILLGYLNIVYFGDGVYGIEAAAKHYFSVPAKDLTLPQAAMIAGLVRDPVSLDAEKNEEAVHTRRDLVLSRMYETKAVPEAEARAAMKQPLGLRLTETPNGCANSSPQFFCDYAESLLLAEPALGNTRDERRKRLYGGGLTIRTTLDRKAQKAAEAAIRKAVHPTDNAVAAISMVEPGTGHLKAMAQSRPMPRGSSAKKGETFINYNVGRKSHGGLGYQPGSTFKPFVMAAAIKQGISLDARLPSPERAYFPTSIKTCKGQHRTNEPAPVVNSTKAEGSTSTIVSGTTRSVNTFYAELEARTGVCEPFKMATAAGVQRGDGAPLEQVQSFVLGVNEVTPLSMAEAYATFAARGKHCDATPLIDVRDRRGAKLPIAGADCEQVIPQDVADGVNYVLRQVIDGDDPSRTAKAMHLDGRQAAGKTGTNSARKVVSFAGYTSNLAAFATIADAHPRLRTLIGQRIGGEQVGRNEVWGGRLSGPIWKAAMEGALKGVESPDFTEPDPKVIEGVKIDVPQVVGMGRWHARNVLRDAGFSVAFGDSEYSSEPKGTVIKQWPAHRASAGSVITLTISDGPEPSDDPQKKCDLPNPPPTCDGSDPGPDPRKTPPEDD
ncbi:transglycosylase domain-containing protein [Flindersiella endophytica]